MSLISFPKVVFAGLTVAMAAKFGVAVMPNAAAMLSGVAEAAATAEPEPAAAAAAPPAVTSDSQICAAPDAIAQAIRDERDLLLTQRDKIAEREAELALSEESLRAERGRLVALRDEIQGQLDMVEQAYGQDLSKLVALYRNMKPQVAAGIMDEMDLEVAVLVLGAMQERDAAQILGQLSLVRARAISKIILERSKLPGDQDLTGLKLQ